ncbi:MAG: hydrogenase maturation nickel metallochaperone HypA [Candidatus Thermoplasmatota archaeon]
MHESAAAQQIVRTVLSEAGRRRATEVTSVDVEIGELDGFREVALREAFAIEAKGTPLEHTTLNVHVRAGRGLVIQRASFVT